MGHWGSRLVAHRRQHCPSLLLLTVQDFTVRGLRFRCGMVAARLTFEGNPNEVFGSQEVLLLSLLISPGLMVLRPDEKLFQEMLRQVPLLPSYDSGDGGFLNSFFGKVFCTLALCGQLFDFTIFDERKDVWQVFLEFLGLIFRLQFCMCAERSEQKLIKRT